MTLERKNDDLALSDLEINAGAQELSEPSFLSAPKRPLLSERSSVLSIPEFDPDTQEPSLRPPWTQLISRYWTPSKPSLPSTPTPSELDYRYWARKEAKRLPGPAGLITRMLNLRWKSISS
jgi:hypothetical protein